MPVTKKEREVRYLSALLQSFGEDLAGWRILEQRERPDFLVASPRGELIGIELTELVEGSDGEVRGAERLVCKAIQETVAEFIHESGGLGAWVHGNNQGIAPVRRNRLDLLRTGLRRHLEAQGESLKRPRGSMSVPFEHEWGEIVDITRSDDEHMPEVRLLLDRPDRLPPYKGHRSVKLIEASIIQTLRSKVRKSAAYSTDWPVWLAMRNPYQRIGVLSEDCLQQVEELNHGCFVRAFMFNDPEDVLDARPPPPYFIRIW